MSGAIGSRPELDKLISDFEVTSNVIVIDKTIN